MTHERPVSDPDASAQPQAPWDEGAYVALLENLVDPDACWFDHHGGCQAHGYLWLGVGQICPHAEAKERIAAYRAEHPRTDPGAPGDGERGTR